MSDELKRTTEIDELAMIGQVEAVDSIVVISRDDDYLYFTDNYLRSAKWAGYALKMEVEGSEATKELLEKRRIMKRNKKR